MTHCLFRQGFECWFFGDRLKRKFQTKTLKLICPHNNKYSGGATLEVRDFNLTHKETFVAYTFYDLKIFD